MDNLLDTVGAPLAGMALGILLLVWRHWWRRYRAAAWARTQRGGLLAVEDWGLGRRRGRVYLDGDELEWRFERSTYRSPRRVPADQPVREVEDDYSHEAWALEVYVDPDGRRVHLGVAAEARDSFVAARRGTSSGLLPPSRRTSGVTATWLVGIGVVVLAASALMWGVWATSFDVSARVVSVERDSCEVTWYDREADVRRDVTVDCYDTPAGRHYAVGDTIPVRAHTGIFRGEGVSHQGVSQFLRYWCPPLGAAFVLAGVLRGAAVRRRVPKAVRLRPLSAGPTESTPDPLARPDDERFVARVLWASRAAGWDDAGEPPEPHAPTWWDRALDLEGWWALGIPPVAWAMLAPEDGSTLWDVGAFVMTVALLLVQIGRLVARTRREAALEALPWGEPVECVGVPGGDDVSFVLLLDRGRPAWVLPVLGTPPRRARLEPRGELRSGVEMQLRRGSDVWRGVGGLERFDEGWREALDETMDDLLGRSDAGG